MQVKQVVVGMVALAIAAAFPHFVQAEKPSKTIVETAVAAGQFKTLVTAVKEAGLVDTLSGKGPFTVFAPTDEAFAKLPAGTVESLLKPENKDKLVAILTYHVAAGKFPASKVVKANAVPTVQGSEVSVKVSDAGVFLNESVKVVKTDIFCSNGVIHVIDAVLLPPTDKDARARRMIEQAVAAGAPMFNHGRAAHCAQVYLHAAHELKRMDVLSENVSAHMEASIGAASEMHCPIQRSWMLRRALDAAYADLSAAEPRMMSAAPPRNR